ncbi:hypothetical protein EJB05_28619, partial [Eragrostis curvula]
MDSTLGAATKRKKTGFMPLSERVHLSELSALSEATAAVFIPRKQWFVVGDNDGNIKVCNDETMQQFKTFRSHDRRISYLDIHPSEPYVLSASYRDDTVKMWNWEMDWECVRTFDVRAREVKFNPKDADYFACATDYGVKIWNIASPGSDDLTFYFRSSCVISLDYLSRGDELYLITGNWDGSVKVRHRDDRSSTPCLNVANGIIMRCIVLLTTQIWDWQSRSCLKTLKEHTANVYTICAHPDLPLFITGSFDGTVCLWNSFTFE